jgi:hypothetical protein
MALTDESILFAVRNIARHGDTDVFPFPLENHWFHDDEAEVVKLLRGIDDDFDLQLRSHPIHFVKSLSSVGHNGFRAATQIDPLWNAYLLALVIEIGPDIEAKRLRVEQNSVFSYRFHPSTERYTPYPSNRPWVRAIQGSRSSKEAQGT